MTKGVQAGPFGSPDRFATNSQARSWGQDPKMSSPVQMGLCFLRVPCVGLVKRTPQPNLPQTQHDPNVLCWFWRLGSLSGVGSGFLKTNCSGGALICHLVKRDSVGIRGGCCHTNVQAGQLSGPNYVRDSDCFMQANRSNKKTL